MFLLFLVVVLFRFMQVSMFSMYCEKKFEVEPVEVTYTDGRSYVSPDLSLYQMVVPLSYIHSIVGVKLPSHEVSYSAND